MNRELCRRFGITNGIIHSGIIKLPSDSLGWRRVDETPLPGNFQFTWRWPKYNYDVITDRTLMIICDRDQYFGVLDHYAEHEDTRRKFICHRVEH